MKKDTYVILNFRLKNGIFIFKNFQKLSIQSGIIVVFFSCLIRNVAKIMLSNNADYY